MSEIFNPKSHRFVWKDGKIGKELLKIYTEEQLVELHEKWRNRYEEKKQEDKKNFDALDEYGLELWNSRMRLLERRKREIEKTTPCYINPPYVNDDGEIIGGDILQKHELTEGGRMLYRYKPEKKVNINPETFEDISSHISEIFEDPAKYLEKMTKKYMIEVANILQFKYTDDFDKPSSKLDVASYRQSLIRSIGITKEIINSVGEEQVQNNQQVE